jgi:hypothetical protein
VEPREAADIIQAISDSLRSDPHQFQISVRVSGQTIASHGGTGLSITASGGGPGSTTVGQMVSMGGAQIQIARHQADQAMTQQVAALIDSLDAIAAELRSPSPEKSRIERILDSLKDTWVPGLILGVLSNALSSAIGL